MRARPWLRRCIAWATLGAAWALGAAVAHADVSARGWLEVGPELDSNPLRHPTNAAPASRPGLQRVIIITPPPSRIVAAALMRLAARGSLLWQATPRQRVLVTYGGGGKLFLARHSCAAKTVCEQDANEMVHLARVNWAIALARATLAIDARYHDAFEGRSRTDFRGGGASVGVGVSPFGRGGPRLVAQAGYYGLQYKPAGLDAFSYHAFRGDLTLRQALQSGDPDEPVDWRLEGGYVGEARFFGTIDCPSGANGCSRRLDHNHTFHIGVRYFGNANAGLSYKAEINSSSSVDPTASYVRHIVELKLSAATWWNVYATARGRYFFTPTASRPLRESQDTALGDSDVSSLLVQLSRDMGAHWGVLARYGLYINQEARRLRVDEFTGETTEYVLPAMLRHTLFLGVRLHYEPGL